MTTPRLIWTKLWPLAVKWSWVVTVIPDMVTMALFADPDGNVTGLVKG